MAQVNMTPLTDHPSDVVNAMQQNILDLAARMSSVEGELSVAQYGLPPGAPTIGAVTAGINSATVAFTPPTFTGTSTIANYTVLCSNGSSVQGASSPITMYQLTPGASYTFQVFATNLGGPGPVSAPSSPVTVSAAPPPASAPGAPTNVSATAGTNQAYVSFTVPTTDGGAPITSYIATASDNVTTGTATGSPILVTGLGAQSYTFTVQAVNSSGLSAPSVPSAAVTVTPVLSAPGAPTTVTVAAGQTSAAVSFVAPANTGNSAITGYTATAAATGQTSVTGTSTASPIVLTGLASNVTWAVTVTATNAVGTSAASTPSAGFTLTGAVAGINLLPAGYGTTAVGASGYIALSGSGTAITPVASTAVTMGATTTSMKVTAVDTTGIFFLESQTVAVTAGQTYSGLVSVNAATHATSAVAKIQWMNSSYTVLATTTSNAFAVALGATVAMNCSAIAPAGATLAQIIGQTTSSTTGDVVYFTNFEMSLGTVTTWTAGGSNLVTNPSAVTDASGVTANNDIASVAATRVTGLSGGGSATTGYQLTATSSNAYTYLLAPIAYQNISVGTKVTISAWVNIGTAAGSIGTKIANVSNTGTISTATYYTTVGASAGWTQLTLTTTATTAATAGDGIFVDLPKTTAFTAQVKDLSVVITA